MIPLLSGRITWFIRGQTPAAENADPGSEASFGDRMRKPRSCWMLGDGGNGQVGAQDWRVNDSVATRGI